MSRISYAVAKRVVDVPHVGMVNLIAGRRLVPELIQDDFIAERVVDALRPLLIDGPAREQMKAGLREVRTVLERPTLDESRNGVAQSTQTAIEAVAEIALSYTRSAKTSVSRPVSVS
jgi:lipid-A-disaccharide synthase